MELLAIQKLAIQQCHGHGITLHPSAFSRKESVVKDKCRKVERSLLAQIEVSDYQKRPCQPLFRGKPMPVKRVCASVC